jgi:hypothetical protein
MKSLKELLQKATINKSTISKEADNWLIEHGYIKTEVYGWEKPEHLTSMALSPDVRGVPCHLTDEWDTKEQTVQAKDMFGRRTGEKQVEVIRFKTGRKVWAPTPNYMAFRDFKKQMYNKWYMEKYGTPFPETES